MAADSPPPSESYNEKGEGGAVENQTATKGKVESSEGPVQVETAKTKELTPVSFTSLFRCSTFQPLPCITVLIGVTL